MPPVHKLLIFLDEQLDDSLGSSAFSSDIWEFHPRVLCNASFPATRNTLAVKCPAPNVSQALACSLLPSVHSVRHFGCKNIALGPTESSPVMGIWLSRHASTDGDVLSIHMSCLNQRLIGF